jgi:hypothetical protein
LTLSTGAHVAGAVAATWLSLSLLPSRVDESQLVRTIDFVEPPPGRAAAPGGDRREPGGADERGSPSRPRLESALERRREHDRAAAEREEPCRHQLRVGRVAGGKPADVLVTYLILVLTSLGGEPRRCEREGSGDPRERSESFPPPHGAIVEMARSTGCARSPTARKSTA